MPAGQGYLGLRRGSNIPKGQARAGGLHGGRQEGGCGAAVAEAAAAAVLGHWHLLPADAAAGPDCILRRRRHGRRPCLPLRCLPACPPPLRARLPLPPADCLPACSCSGLLAAPGGRQSGALPTACVRAPSRPLIVCLEPLRAACRPLRATCRPLLAASAGSAVPSCCWRSELPAAPGYLPPGTSFPAAAAALGCCSPSCSSASSVAAAMSPLWLT